VTIDVKCAGCNSYFPLSLVVQEDNGYYCKKCLRKHREKLRRGSESEAKCIFCNKVLREGDWNTHGGYRYCNDCLKTIADKSKDSNRYKCSVCGKLMYPMDARMVSNGKEFCEKCYHSMHDSKGEEKIYKCTNCGKLMGPFEVKMRAGQNYCLQCYGEVTDSWEQAFKKALRAESILSSKDIKHFLEQKDGGIVPESQAQQGEKMGERKPKEVYADIAQLFKCLGDPCRVKIIESLSDHDMSVFAFVEITGFQYSAISYHLKMLKDMGLVYSFRNGNFQVYSLTNKGATVHEFIKKSTGLSKD